jgi:hypothetical protein
MPMNQAAVDRVLGQHAQAKRFGFDVGHPFVLRACEGFLPRGPPRLECRRAAHDVLEALSATDVWLADEVEPEALGTFIDIVDHREIPPEPKGGGTDLRGKEGDALPHAEWRPRRWQRPLQRASLCRHQTGLVGERNLHRSRRLVRSLDRTRREDRLAAIADGERRGDETVEQRVRSFGA